MEAQQRTIVLRCHPCTSDKARFESRDEVCCQAKHMASIMDFDSMGSVYCTVEANHHVGMVALNGNHGRHHEIFEFDELAMFCDIVSEIIALSIFCNVDREDPVAIAAFLPRVKDLYPGNVWLQNLKGCLLYAFLSFGIMYWRCWCRTTESEDSSDSDPDTSNGTDDAEDEGTTTTETETESSVWPTVTSTDVSDSTSESSSGDAGYEADSESFDSEDS